MAKYYGKIGFASTAESPEGSGIWVEKITERPYYGDVLKVYKRYENGEGLNDDLNISNQLSIIADPYLNSNLSSVRYVSWLGALWKVTGVEVQFPRLILTIGGVYNGNQN